MIHWNDRRTSRIAFGLAATIITVLVLSACTGVRDDDSEPTESVSTVAVPSDATQEAETSVSPSSPSDATPESADGTVVATPSGDAASPTSGIVVSAPPITVPTMTPTIAAGTPASNLEGATPAEAVIPSDAAGGDGTGGAPAIATESDEVGDTSAASPPAASVNGDVAMVTSCDVASFPPYSGESPQQITSVEVNFRAGPGSDCNAIGQPIAAGETIEVLSDPVQRQGDEFLWVAAAVDGTQGWLATEFLDPVAATS